VSEQLNRGLTDEDLEREVATDLPAREAMSLINPGGTPNLPILPDGAEGGTTATQDHMPVYQIQDVTE